MKSNQYQDAYGKWERRDFPVPKAYTDDANPDARIVLSELYGWSGEGGKIPYDPLDTKPVYSVTLYNLRAPDIEDYNTTERPSAILLPFVASFTIAGGIATFFAVKAWRRWKKFRQNITEVVP